MDIIIDNEYGSYRVTPDSVKLPRRYAQRVLKFSDVDARPFCMVDGKLEVGKYGFSHNEMLYTDEMENEDVVRTAGRYWDGSRIVVMWFINGGTKRVLEALCGYKPEVSEYMVYMECSDKKIYGVTVGEYIRHGFLGKNDVKEYCEGMERRRRYADIRTRRAQWGEEMRKWDGDRTCEEIGRIVRRVLDEWKVM